MWIFSKYGFVSVVRQSEAPHKLMVRSRSRAHLKNLKKAFKLGGRIRASQQTDYEFRMFVTTEEWARVVAAMVARIDYPNFKYEAERNIKTVGREYVTALHEVWAVVHDHLKKIAFSRVMWHKLGHGGTYEKGHSPVRTVGA